MTIDLHLHTDFSDGNWSPAELVEHCVSIKLRHIAVTDHDTVYGINEAQDAAQGRLEIIPGVEVNTVSQRPDGTSEDIHILGYFIDPSNSALSRLLSRQRDARSDHARRCVDRVASTGIPITFDMVMRHTGRGGIGKMHLTQAIIEAQGAGDAGEAYDRYLARTSPYYEKRASVSPEEAIAAIRDAGGIPSIAHPGKGEHMFDLILRLKEHGLQAIEAYHRMHSVNRVKQYIRFANRNGMLVTGGSDCHGPFREYAATAGSISIPAEVLANLRKAARTCASV